MTVNKIRDKNNYLHQRH